MKNSFCSWSGGKDSCLALYKSIRAGFVPKYLVTMMTENPERSRSHGLHKDLLLKQSEMMGIPLITKSTSWNDYEKNFISVLKKLKKEKINHGIFGDIDLQEHLDWIKKVTNKAGIKFHEPLWKMKRADVIKEFLSSGFKAKIIACKKSVMDEKYLGRDLSFKLLSELELKGIDGAGENGEFHTFVYDSPIFKKEIQIEKKGIHEKEGYLFLDIS